MLFTLDLLDSWRRLVPVEVMIRRETVELRCQEHLVGVADRDYLRSWLGAPFGVFAHDDCAWLHLAPGIALCIGDVVSSHILNEHVVNDLRSRL
jgi:hypothetical protein